MSRRRRSGRRGKYVGGGGTWWLCWQMILVSLVPATVKACLGDKHFEYSKYIALDPLMQHYECEHLQFLLYGWTLGRDVKVCSAVAHALSSACMEVDYISADAFMHFNDYNLITFHVSFHHVLPGTCPILYVLILSFSIAPHTIHSYDHECPSSDIHACIDTIFSGCSVWLKIY